MISALVLLDGQTVIRWCVKMKRWGRKAGAYGSERGCVRRRRRGRRAGRRRGRGRRGRPWGSTATPARPAPAARSPRSPTAPPPAAAAAPWRRLRPTRATAAAADIASSLATSRSARSEERKVELAATASPRRRHRTQDSVRWQAFPERERGGMQTERAQGVMAWWATVGRKR